MEWLPAVVVLLLAVGITVSLLLPSKTGRRWYTGGTSWLDRDNEGTPVERTDNVRSKYR